MPTHSTASSFFDIAVVGRGPIGAAAALSAERQGLTVAWIGGEPPVPATAPGQWDSRVFALSALARSLLRELRVWAALDQARIAPVYDMRVLPGAATDLSPVEELHFCAFEGRTEALAWIVEGSNLNAAFRQAVGFSRIEVHEAQLRALEVDATTEAVRAGAATLELDDGRIVRARLVVAADGAESAVRRLAAIGSELRPYPQTALVANFATTISHADCAWQWFGPHGVLALLPLPGQHCSMVWSAPHELAGELQALDGPALAERVQALSGGVLGRLTLLGSPAAFALRRIDVHSLIGPRLVLAGDAAHVVHPLAGQGMNLGFADVAALSRVWREREPFRDLGDRLLLRRYERGRRESVSAMTLATDGLQRLFDPQALNQLGPLGTPVRLARDIGWSVLARSSWLKRQLMSAAAT